MTIIVIIQFITIYYYYNYLLIIIDYLFNAAVRYGRVPKRSRERGGSTPGDDGAVNANVNGVRSPQTFADPSTPDSSDSCSAAPFSAPSSAPSSAASSTASSAASSAPSSAVAGGVASVGGVASDADGRQLVIYDTILTVTQAHHAHCAYTEEKTRAIVRSPIAVVSSNSINLIQFISIVIISSIVLHCLFAA